jgi:ADP-heptose:LPS heptosyltransferase
MLAARYKVGILGMPDTTGPISGPAVMSWAHPDGPDAGCVDLLTHCKLYLGGDSGVTHLAAMMDTPMIIVTNPDRRRDNQVGVIQRANLNYFKQIDDWHNPNEVIRSAHAYLTGRI